MRITLEACVGKLVRVQWRDIVEDSSTHLDVERLRAEHRRWALSWTTGVLLAADAQDVFIATSLGVEKTDAGEKGNSVIQIPRPLVTCAYLLRHGPRVSLRPGGEP